MRLKKKNHRDCDVFPVVSGPIENLFFPSNMVRNRAMNDVFSLTEQLLLSDMSRPAGLVIGISLRSCCRVYQNVRFMHDAPAYLPIKVRNQLHATWIGRSGSMDMHPCFPDLSRLDFSWNHMKSLVYKMPVENLTIRNVIASDEITRTPDLLERVR
ncbi:hypothetical protein TNCV_1931091 [Trichonephila clavipes]|nr:hypothetical protein TNCV_1931091 [Trichonephila clavipes]